MGAEMVICKILSPLLFYNFGYTILISIQKCKIYDGVDFDIEKNWAATSSKRNLIIRIALPQICKFVCQMETFQNTYHITMSLCNGWLWNLCIY